ncbi:unnamed protein product [Pedinophyceae sp. YPF-701]|nr:unnamed protein product [Pedinophyceae sp. YPF-701]
MARGNRVAHGEPHTARHAGNSASLCRWPQLLGRRASPWSRARRTSRHSRKARLVRSRTAQDGEGAVPGSGGSIRWGRAGAAWTAPPHTPPAAPQLAVTAAPGSFPHEQLALPQGLDVADLAAGWTQQAMVPPVISAEEDRGMGAAQPSPTEDANGSGHGNSGRGGSGRRGKSRAAATGAARERQLQAAREAQARYHSRKKNKMVELQDAVEELTNKVEGLRHVETQLESAKEERARLSTEVAYVSARAKHLWMDRLLHEAWARDRVPVPIVAILEALAVDLGIMTQEECSVPMPKEITTVKQEPLENTEYMAQLVAAVQSDDGPTAGIGVIPSRQSENGEDVPAPVWTRLGLAPHDFKDLTQEGFPKSVTERLTTLMGLMHDALNKNWERWGREVPGGPRPAPEAAVVTEGSNMPGYIWRSIRGIILIVFNTFTHTTASVPSDLDPRTLVSPQLLWEKLGPKQTPAETAEMWRRARTAVGLSPDQIISVRAALDHHDRAAHDMAAAWGDLTKELIRKLTELLGPSGGFVEGHMREVEVARCKERLQTLARDRALADAELLGVLFIRIMQPYQVAATIYHTYPHYFDVRMVAVQLAQLEGSV